MLTLGGDFDILIAMMMNNYFWVRSEQRQMARTCALSRLFEMRYAKLSEARESRTGLSPWLRLMHAMMGRRHAPLSSLSFAAPRILAGILPAHNTVTTRASGASELCEQMSAITLSVARALAPPDVLSDDTPIVLTPRLLPTPITARA